jgi:pimeloyl-ACP methyl ester carboxylesterase
VEVTSGAGRDRVTHLVLSGLAGLPPLSERQRRDFLTTMAPTFALNATGDHLPWLWKRFGRLWGEHAPPELLNEGVAAVVGNLDHYNVAYDSVFDYDPAPGLERIRCPILLLNAANDRYAFADQTVASIATHARIVHIPGISGAIPWQRPELYANEVLNFLTEAV